MTLPATLGLDTGVDAGAGAGAGTGTGAENGDIDQFHFRIAREVEKGMCLYIYNGINNQSRLTIYMKP